MARTDLKLIGAAEERRAVLRKVRRMIVAALDDPEETGAIWLGGLSDWLIARDKRYSEAKGGLGK